MFPAAMLIYDYLMSLVPTTGTHLHPAVRETAGWRRYESFLSAGGRTFQCRAHLGFLQLGIAER